MRLPPVFLSSVDSAHGPGACPAPVVGRGHGRAVVGVIAALLLAVTSGARAQGDVTPPAAIAEATGSGPLETSIEVEKLQVEPDSASGERRRWVPAQRLSAGDELHYTVRVHNPGKVSVTEIVVTKRLPYGVRYEVGSATGPACKVQLSIDGRTFAAAEGSPRTEKGTRKQVAPEYTHVRWVMARPLAPGATALLRFRAKFS